MENSSNWSTGWDADSSTPYAIKEDHVIVYDNPISIKTKVGTFYRKLRIVICEYILSTFLTIFRSNSR